MKYILNIHSENLFAGSDWSWSELLTDYPSTDYNFSIVIKNATADAIVLPGTANADGGFDFSKPAGETSLIIADEYFAQGIVTKISDSTITVIDLENISITALLSANQDPRTYWKKVFDTVREAYLRLVNNETIEETYNGKTYKFADAGKLRAIMNDAENRMIIESDPDASTSKVYKGRFI